MDRALPPRSSWHRQWSRVLLAGLATTAGALAWLQRPTHVEAVDSPRLATVSAGEFRDELALRARVEPLHSVQLDAVEAGRVEAVLVDDGDVVQAGALLFRLHSPELEQLLMERSAEVAQQIANVSIERSVQAASLAQNRRELIQLELEQQRAEADFVRLQRLASAGFVASAVLEDAERRHEVSSRLLRQVREDQGAEAAIRQKSLEDMARAVEGLQRGLQALENSRARLEQHAPLAGRLTDFRLQVGVSVRPGDRLGRIDDPSSGVQLAADVDEFYLPKLQTGQAVSSPHGDLALAQALPQVRDGKVRVLMRWPRSTAEAARLRPGQAVEVRLQLNDPVVALILPDGPGVQSSLYVRQGHYLERRTVRLGRRAAGQVEVLAGLRAGEEVLISQPPSNAKRLVLP